MTGSLDSTLTKPLPYTACPACDLLLERIPPPAGRTLLCPRCGKRLHKEKEHSIELVLALSLTGLLLYIPANFLPLMTMGILGLDKSSSLFGSVLALFTQGSLFVGTMVLFTALLFPLLTLGLLCTVATSIAFNRRSPLLLHLFRLYHHLTEWAMMDVYLIGILIAIIKLTATATLSFDVGLFCFIGMVLSAIGAQAYTDHRLFWRHLDLSEKGAVCLAPSFKGRTASEAGLVVCPTCHKLVERTPLDHDQRRICPRCLGNLRLRKTNSLTRTWALVLTAVILTLPANLLPIMEVEYFGFPEQSTIMDGIIYFFQEGSYGIGLIIFTASILVPLFKIVGILLILLSIHFKWRSWLRHKAIMFGFIQFIGRWSMLDIFVIALLCALVQFGILSTINVAPAAFYFSGVVLTTMFSAISFDVRLLWDTEPSPTSTDHTDHG
jgi:paraquat-inducible protein A